MHHAPANAGDIRRRFANRPATTARAALRRRFLCWRMSLSANRIRHRVKPEGMLRRDMRYHD
jgi:hypothetical protein